MLTKTQLIQNLEQLPENFTIDQLVDYLFFVAKVQQGLNDSLNEKTKTQAEAKEELSKWLK